MTSVSAGRDQDGRQRLHAVLPEAQEGDRPDGRESDDAGAGAGQVPATEGHDREDQPPRATGRGPVSRGLRTRTEKPSLMAAVMSANVNVTQSTTSLTGSTNEQLDLIGEVDRVWERLRDHRGRDDSEGEAKVDESLARAGTVGPTEAGIHPLAGAIGQPVEDDGEDDDRRPAWNACADVDLDQRPEHVRAETGRADQRRDDDHREGHHDRLVDADADGPPGERQLDLRSPCQRVDPSEMDASIVSCGHAADAQGGDADRPAGSRRSSVAIVADGTPMLKSSTIGAR